MAKKKKQYYDITPLLKNDANYYILLGMRANGKSYQAKLTVLTDAYKNSVKFVYLRRFRDDIKQYYVESYFADMNIEEITDGAYSMVIAWQGYLYFANLDEKGQTVRGDRIGRYCALNESTRYKSNAFVAYGWILYEEFITNEVYLSEEPDKLQQFISTVARDKPIKVLLIGNTISRVCPYFSEWMLTGTLKQKPNTIEIYHMKDDKGRETSRIAVENCTVVDSDSKMFFGKATKQILSGEWDVKISPRLPKKIKDFEELYRLQIQYQMFIFNMVLLIDSDDGAIYTYIYPAKKLKEDGRILSTDFSTNQQQTLNFNHRSKMELKILECFDSGKVCYSDNLTAADFEQVRQQFRFI